MSASDQVRAFVIEHVIRPALKKGQKHVSVRAGDIHSALKFRNRVPLVCQALESEKLLRNEGLRLVKKTGPPSGRSTSVVYIYEVVGKQQDERKGLDSLLSMVGAFKGVFGKGEWEHSIREQRAEMTEKGQRS